MLAASGLQAPFSVRTGSLRGTTSVPGTVLGGGGAGGVGIAPGAGAAAAELWLPAAEVEDDGCCGAVEGSWAYPAQVRTHEIASAIKVERDMK